MIQIQVSPELEARLTAEAEGRGMTVEAYLSALIEEWGITPAGTRKDRQRAVEAMLTFAERHGATLGGGDLRAMRHEGHKY